MFIRNMRYGSYLILESSFEGREEFNDSFLNNKKND